MRRYTSSRAALIYFRYVRVKLSRAPADRFVHEFREIVDGAIEIVGKEGQQ
jgi:hypothetical protein